MKRWVWALGFLVVGCQSGNQALMPLKPKKTWTYAVRPGFKIFIEPVTVTREVAVGDAKGYELAGAMGVTRLAWRGSQLITDQAANAMIRPPLPLITARDRRTIWSGWVGSMGKWDRADADIVNKEEKLALGGRTLSTLRSTVSMHLPTRDLKLDTWFVEGQGIVQQEQRNGPELDVQIQLVNP